MKFEDLLDSLPNGFHDAQLSRFSIDYAARTIEFDSKIWVGSMQSPPGGRELYRPAIVSISSFQFCVIEPPNASYPYDLKEPLTFDARLGKLEKMPKLPPTKPGNFLCWFFVNEWNSFFWISAEGIDLRWTGQAEINPG